METICCDDDDDGGCDYGLKVDLRADFLHGSANTELVKLYYRAEMKMGIGEVEEK